MPRLAFSLLCVTLASCGGSEAPIPQASLSPADPPIMAAAATTEAPCDIDLANPIVIPPDPPPHDLPPGQHPISNPAKRAYRLSDGSVVFVGRVTVDADGAPRAYNPSDTGLDLLDNGGEPGNWWALATDAPNCGTSGKPILQQAGDPAPGFYVTKTTMTNPAVGNCKLQRNYVDSSKIPYVAFSPLVAQITGNKGRYAVVGRLSGGEVQLAIQADAASKHGIGEASIELTRRLGLNPNPKSGGTQAREFIYVAMPPHETASFPANVAAVETGAGDAFQRWGGEARLKTCRQAVAAAPR
jgi:hypothetical protein